MNNIPILFHLMGRYRPSLPKQIFFRQNKNPSPGFISCLLSFIIPWIYDHYSSIRRTNSEIPKSTTAKNTVKNATVARTVIV